MRLAENVVDDLNWDNVVHRIEKLLYSSVQLEHITYGWEQFIGMKCSQS